MAQVVEVQPGYADPLDGGLPSDPLLEAVTAVTEAIPNASWLTVYIHTPRDVAAAWIAARGTGDDVSRLRAWDQTEPFADAGLVLDTATVQPD